jgi:acetoin utilization protein AcuB
MRLKEIMSTKVESVRPDETIARARAQMRLKSIHHLVVRDHRRVTGILTDTALETRDAEGVERVEDAMFRNVVTGTPDMTVRRAANMLRGRADGALPVVSAGKLVGIITVSDLLDVLGRGVDRPAPKDRWILRHRGIRPKTR